MPATVPTEEMRDSRAAVWGVHGGDEGLREAEITAEWTLGVKKKTHNATAAGRVVKVGTDED